MIKVPIYIERRDLEIMKKILLTKFNYLDNYLKQITRAVKKEIDLRAHLSFQNRISNIYKIRY